MLHEHIICNVIPQKLNHYRNSYINFNSNGVQIKICSLHNWFHFTFSWFLLQAFKSAAITSVTAASIFLKGIFVQEGSSRTRFDHGQFKNKTLPYSHPALLLRGKYEKSWQILIRIQTWDIHVTASHNALQRRTDLSSRCKQRLCTVPWKLSLSELGYM